jgi:hypothetical protein
VSLRTPSSSQSPDHDPHRTIYYLGYPFGSFAGLKHRQLARQVGVIITTGRIRRTFISKINLLHDKQVVEFRFKASRHISVKTESDQSTRRASCRVGSSRRVKKFFPPGCCVRLVCQSFFSDSIHTPREFAAPDSINLVLNQLTLSVPDSKSKSTNPKPKARRVGPCRLRVQSGVCLRSQAIFLGKHHLHRFI